MILLFQQVVRILKSFSLVNVIAKIEAVFNNAKFAYLVAFGTFIALILYKIFLNRESFGPLIAYDEWFFTYNANSIFLRNSYAEPIYPPLYPLIISWAFFFGSQFYKFILIINSIVSSSLVLAIWFLARRLLSNAAALVVVIFSVFLPYHYVLSGRLVLAENLTWPLFVWAVLILITTYNKSSFDRIKIDFLFGFSVALLYLTKFNFLISIPVFFLLRFLFILSDNKISGLSRPILETFNRLLISFISGLIPFCAWVFYGNWSGLPLFQTSGLYLASLGTVEPQLDRLPFWIFVNCIFIVFITLPLFPGLLLLITSNLSVYVKKTIKIYSTRNIDISALFERLSDQSLRLFITSVMMGSAFVAMAINHGLIQSFNYPTPSLLSSRYYEFIYPLIMILSWRGVFLRPKTKNSLFLSFCMVIASGISILAYNCLFSQLLWPLPPWFANAIGTHTFSTILSTSNFASAWIIASVLIAFFSFKSWSSNRGYFFSNIIIIMINIILGLYSLPQIAQATASLSIGGPGDHWILSEQARHVAQLLESRDDNKNIALFSALPDIIPDRPAPNDHPSLFYEYLNYWSLKNLEHIVILTNDGRWYPKAPSHDAIIVGITPTQGANCFGNYKLPYRNNSYFICTGQPSLLAYASSQLQKNPEIVFSSGWSETERTHRWTQSNTAEILFNLSSSPSASAGCNLKIDAISAGKQEVGLLVNGTPIESKSIDAWFPGEAYDYKVPGYQFKVGKNSLVFMISSPRVFPPDNRALGFGLIDLLLTCN